MSRKAEPYSELIHRAMEYAARAHEGQLRKNRESKVPYFSHCAVVARVLDKAGFDEEVVAAGLLHDVVEDSKATLSDIADLFGKRIADLVDHVTEEDKTLKWEVRKTRYLEKLARAPFEALAIACADKIHNLWSQVLCAREGGDVWGILSRGREQQLERFERIAALFRARFDHPLRDLFEEVLKIVKKEC